MLSAFLPLLACSPPDPGATRIIGHGGSGAHAEFPMNSRESLLGAFQLGVDGIELDAQLTADSVLIAFHPLQLKEGTACAGIVHARTWAELQDCHPFLGEAQHPFVRIDSLLIQAIAAYPAADFTLDCKLITEGDWWSYLHAFSDAIVLLDEQPALRGRISVDCQTEDLLRLLGLKRAGFPTYYYAQEFEGAIERARSAGCVGITVAYDRISLEQAAQVRSAGLSLTLFGTTTERSHRQAFNLRPDRLQTDLPAYACSLRPSAH